MKIRLLMLFLATLIVTPGMAQEAAEQALCSVCRVHDGETEMEPVVATAMHDGTRYGFCSKQCRDTFARSPENYLPRAFPRPAPAFAVVDLNGQERSRASLEGSWVLLDFWATWCPPCLADLPKLSALHARHDDLIVLGISIDEEDDAAKQVARVVKKRKAMHPIALDSTGSAWEAFEVRVVPTQFLIDPNGQIVAQWSGEIDLEAVEAEIMRQREKASAGP